MKIMLKDKNELIVMYYITINALEKYIKEKNKRPNEKEWNKFAIKNNYLSSESIGYICEIGFNKLCRKIIKEAHKKKK